MGALLISTVSQSHFQVKTIEKVIDLFFSQTEESICTEKNAEKGCARLEKLLRREIEEKESFIGPLDCVQTDWLDFEKEFVETCVNQKDFDLIKRIDGLCTGLSLAWLREKLNIDSQKWFSQFVKLVQCSQEKPLGDEDFLKLFRAFFKILFIQKDFGDAELIKSQYDAMSTFNIELQKELGIKIKKDGFKNFSVSSKTPHFLQEIQKNITSILEQRNDKNKNIAENQIIYVEFFTPTIEGNFFSGGTLVLYPKKLQEKKLGFMTPIQNLKNLVI